MHVYKFGGASVRSAEAIRNVESILRSQDDTSKPIVISAMGKTTNNLENVVRLYCKGDDDYKGVLNKIVESHINIARKLLGESSSELENVLNEHAAKVFDFCERNQSVHYPFIYDQIVSLGELMSTRIISYFLNQQGIQNEWVDAREIIRTDNKYMAAVVDFEMTESLVKKKLPDLLNNKHVITQGFIAGTSERFTTTLAREGSDYTAAILAYCLDAEKMVVWKDVPGILSADPKLFDNTVKLKELSYLEAIEMTFYGAKVIHPKTIKPLQNKGIPMEVRSFMHPAADGTLIKEEGYTANIPPVVVLKMNQVLITLMEKDFDFVSQSGLGEIIKTFSKHDIKINMMQNGAISFSAVVDYNERKLQDLIDDLNDLFKITRNEKLELLTIRHFNGKKLEELTHDKEVLLMQQTRHTVQVLMKEH
ncbi:MAG: aspartate kinase [Chitinophagales bacterium]|nr:aspartate kinase [Chitinophagales bacterium]